MVKFASLLLNACSVSFHLSCEFLLAGEIFHKTDMISC